MRSYPAPARCFRCRLKLGREQFAVTFQADDALRAGSVLLCGGCFDKFKDFLRGAAIGART